MFFDIGSLKLFEDFLGLKLHLFEDIRGNLQKGAISGDGN
jgi:hypothetical protein